MTVRVGTLGVGKDEQPRVARVTLARTRTVRAGERARFVLRTPPPPFRVEVDVTPTFSPTEYGGTDQRNLGAQVGYAFTSL